jgi:putative ABC transport system permease protein
MNLFNYNLKISLRDLIKQQKWSLLNIAGLAFGFAAIILLSIFVYRDFTYDTFHKNHARIFKPEIEIVDAKANIDIAENVSLKQIEDFRGMVSGLEAITFLNYSRWDRDHGTWVEYNGNKFNLPFMAFTDEYFPQVFSFDVFSGNLTESLKNPNQLVLTKENAEKIFGSENPLGKVVLLNNMPATVGAILESIPTNSSLQFSGLLNYLSASTYFGNPIGDYSCIPFVLTKQAVNVNQVSESVSSVLYNTLSKGEKEEINPVFKTTFVPLASLYFHDSSPYSPLKHGNKKITYVLLFIGVITMALALINYSNLLMAVSLKWEKSFGIHQAFGAGRSIIQKQYFIKGTVISLLAFVLSLLIIALVLPWFNQLALYPLNQFDFLNASSVIIIVTVLFSTLFLAGILPVLFHKSPHLLKQVNANSKPQSKNVFIWQGLVTFQLFISISLIATALLVLKQINYGMNKDLGITTKNVITLPTFKLGDNQSAFIDAVNDNPATSSQCLSSSYLNNYNIWGGVLREPGVNQKDIDYTNVLVNHSFINTLEIDLLMGRNFEETFASDKNKMIVNKAFVDFYHVTNPLKASIDGFEIIGVVDNFNYNSLHDIIEPMVLLNSLERDELSTFRFQASTTNELKNYMIFLNKEWMKLSNEVPFEYEFLDDLLRKMYEEDIKLSRTIVTFSVLAVFIACLGIFGLLSYAMETRIKEIGIRKVNGARIMQIMRLLNFNLVRWVVFATIIAVPVSYIIMHKWLESFAYKTELSWWIFALAGLLALGIALLTVSWQSWRAATRNPVEALRYE